VPRLDQSNATGVSGLSFADGMVFELPQKPGDGFARNERRRF
jgi:hypothetical protein